MTKFKVLFICLLAYLPVKAQDASAIFKKATGQLLTTNMELTIEIKEFRKNGRVKEKSFNVLLGKFNQEEKIKTEILKPERAKGVIIVVTQYPDKVGLIEILTPSNGKVRKMKATPKNIELVGGGSLLSSYTTKNISELDVRYLEKQQINGKSYYKIAVNDKIDAKNGKAEFLIEENTHHISQIISYDTNNLKESITKLSNFKVLDTKIHPEIIAIEDVKNKTSSAIKVLKIKRIADLKKEDFNIVIPKDN